MPAVPLSIGEVAMDLVAAAQSGHLVCEVGLDLGSLRDLFALRKNMTCSGYPHYYTLDKMGTHSYFYLEISMRITAWTCGILVYTRYVCCFLFLVSRQ